MLGPSFGRKWPKDAFELARFWQMAEIWVENDYADLQSRKLLWMSYTKLWILYLSREQTAGVFYMPSLSSNPLLQMRYSHPTRGHEPFCLDQLNETRRNQECGGRSRPWSGRMEEKVRCKKVLQMQVHSFKKRRMWPHDLQMWLRILLHLWWKTLRLRMHKKRRSTQSCWIIVKRSTLSCSK